MKTGFTKGKLAGVFISLLLCASCGQRLPEGKAIYQPEEFAGQDWWSDDNDYSYRRMECTENLAVFWQKGFGDDLSNPPELDGNDMHVDMANLKARLEWFYRCFRDTLQFVKPGSESEKYRMMVMIMYSLEGTAYGGTYDDKIGAFWAAPNRLQDEKLNAVAHELGHSFQLQVIADKAGEAWGGSGFYEMASQWMLWQVNPLWVTDENYHWQAFKMALHKAFLHMENIYRSPYVLEYWSEKHGLPFIAEMFRQGKKGEDPVITYKRMTGLTQEAFNDEMLDAYLHLVNMDYSRVYDETREWANGFEPFSRNMEKKGDWWQVKKEFCPENYGFNVIKLDVPEAGGKVVVRFEGLPNEKGYNILNGEKAGWRYAIVGVTQGGKSIVGNEIGRDAKGEISFETPEGEPLAHLWLVVMGAPTEHWMNGRPGTDAQWPYRLKVSGSKLL